MRLNFTFFVQVINFSIVYWFLNKFMFRPILLFLQQKKEKENLLQKKVAHKESDLLMLSKKMDDNLIEFKENMKERYAVIPVKMPPIPSKIVGKVDKKEAKKLIQQAKNILVKRVPHVD